MIGGLAINPCASCAASGQAIAAAAQRERVEFPAPDGARAPDVNYLVHPLFGKDLSGAPLYLAASAGLLSL